jgi:hypothetical protein
VKLASAIRLNTVPETPCNGLVQSIYRKELSRVPTVIFETSRRVETGDSPEEADRTKAEIEAEI